MILRARPLWLGQGPLGPLIPLIPTFPQPNVAGQATAAGQQQPASAPGGPLPLPPPIPTDGYGNLQGAWLFVDPDGIQWIIYRGRDANGLDCMNKVSIPAWQSGGIWNPCAPSQPVGDISPLPPPPQAASGDLNSRARDRLSALQNRISALPADLQADPLSKLATCQAMINPQGVVLDIGVFACMGNTEASVRASEQTAASRPGAPPAPNPAPGSPPPGATTIPIQNPSQGGWFPPAFSPLPIQSPGIPASAPTPAPASTTGSGTTTALVAGGIGVAGLAAALAFGVFK